MTKALPLFLLLVPVIEVVGFVVIGNAIGVLPTLLWLLITMAAGVAILRAQPLRLVAEVRASAARRDLPLRPLFDTAIRATAGLLLLIPGFFTDLLALLLLLPPVQTFVYAFMARTAMHGGQAVWASVRSGQHSQGRAPTIDGDFTAMDPDSEEKPGRRLIDPDDHPGGAARSHEPETERMPPNGGDRHGPR